MVGVAGIGALVGLLVGGLQFAGGFALGAALGLINYLWLHQAVETLFAAKQRRVPRKVVAKFALRYPLAFVGVYFIYRTGWLSVTALLAGLFVPVAGVLIESAFQIVEGLQIR